MSTAFEARAGALYERYAYPDWLRRHSLVVGRAALLLALDHADAVDVASVALGGYLHDIGRSPLLAGDPRDHNELGALVLRAEGLPECAALALRHPVYAVHDPRTAPRDLAERIVYYADRRGGMTILPLDERITETAVRHPEYAGPIERARPLAREIERAVYARTSSRPEDLARLVAARWP
ncbi:MAG: HD domain-containing protein [Chloroflexota bacterium]|nr:HD domain-containing protein [Chloroflexota bacterium]MDE3194532.1 HD domain-containing protein [Chloroflexota bacterium]